MCSGSPQRLTSRSRSRRRASMRRSPLPTDFFAAEAARVASRPSGSRNRTEPDGRLVCQLGEVAGLAADQRVPHRQGHAVLETHVALNGVEQPVDPRGAVGVGARQAGHAQRRPLDRDRRVLLGHPHDRPPHLACERARLADGGGVEVELLGGARGHGVRLAVGRCSSGPSGVSPEELWCAAPNAAGPPADCPSPGPPGPACTAAVGPGMLASQVHLRNPHSPSAITRGVPASPGQQIRSRSSQTPHRNNPGQVPVSQVHLRNRLRAPGGCRGARVLRVRMARRRAPGQPAASLDSNSPRTPALRRMRSRAASAWPGT